MEDLLEQSFHSGFPSLGECKRSAMKCLQYASENYHKGRFFGTESIEGRAMMLMDYSKVYLLALPITGDNLHFVDIGYLSHWRLTELDVVQDECPDVVTKAVGVQFALDMRSNSSLRYHRLILNLYINLVSCMHCVGDLD